MKRDAFTIALGLADELLIDNFAASDNALVSLPWLPKRTTAPGQRLLRVSDDLAERVANHNAALSG